MKKHEIVSIEPNNHSSFLIDESHDRHIVINSNNHDSSTWFYMIGKNE